MPKISELFNLEYGHSLELNRLKQSNAPDAINFVGRAARNNGVTARVSPVSGVAPAKAGTLSVALSGQGGAGVAFLQPAPYYCGFHVMVLTPKTDMGEKELLWWATCITANRFRFGFGRQANRTLKDIELPRQEDTPSWVGSVDFRQLFVATLTQLKELSRKSPSTAPNAIGETRVSVDDIFDVTYGNSLELNRLTRNPAGVNFVARTAKNNGIAARVSCPPDESPIPGDCLSVALSGSVLETFVQKEAFLTGFHVMVLRPKEPMCMEELMFYAACVRANQWRYSYGRQANRTLKDLRIPARGSVPDWIYGSFTRVPDQLILTTC
jgi:hypothetical protein